MTLSSPAANRAGIAGNSCVLFTAHDAFMRDFHLIIPSDCVASNTLEDNRYALEHMRNVLQASIVPFSEIDWSKLRQRATEVWDAAKT